MEKYNRPYNENEIVILKSKKHSYWQHFENFGMKWIAVTFILISPFLLYEKFVNDVSSRIQLVTLIIIVITSIFIVFYWMNKLGEVGWNKKVDNEIKNGKAEVIRIKTEKVYKRKDPEDFGSGFYLKISESETLFLQGQYFDELQYSRKFPNTDFEIVRTSMSINRQLLKIEVYGKYLKPIKKIKPFTDDQYKKGDIHYDGDVLKISIENIK